MVEGSPLNLVPCVFVVVTVCTFQLAGPAFLYSSQLCKLLFQGLGFGASISVGHDHGFQIPIQLDSAIHNRIRIGLDFEKISTGSDMDIQTALITAEKCLFKVFFRI